MTTARLIRTARVLRILHIAVWVVLLAVLAFDVAPGFYLVLALYGAWLIAASGLSLAGEEIAFEIAGDIWSIPAKLGWPHRFFEFAYRHNRDTFGRRYRRYRYIAAPAGIAIGVFLLYLGLSRLVTLALAAFQ